MAQEYSYSELMQMQDRAIERVRQMQERARRTIEADAPEFINEEKEAQEETSPVAERVSSPPQYGRTADKKSIPFLSGTDKDKATVLPLLLLLMNEGADNLLLLALMYIMA